MIEMKVCVDMECLTASIILRSNNLLALNYDRVEGSTGVWSVDVEIIFKLNSFKGLRLKLSLATGGGSLLQAWWLRNDSTSMHRFVSGHGGCGSSHPICVISGLPIGLFTIRGIARTTSTNGFWVIIGIIVIIIEDICFGFITNIA